MRFFRRGGGDDEPKATRAKLGGESTMYYDKEKGRWRERGKEHLEEEEEKLAPPPMAKSKEEPAQGGDSGAGGPPVPGPSPAKQMTGADALIAPPNLYGGAFARRAPAPAAAKAPAAGMMPPMASFGFSADMFSDAPIKTDEDKSGDAKEEQSANADAAGDGAENDESADATAPPAGAAGNPFAKPGSSVPAGNPFAPKSFGAPVAQMTNPNAPRGFGGTVAQPKNPNAPRALRGDTEGPKRPERKAPQKPAARDSPFGAPGAAPPQPVSTDPEGTSGDPEGPAEGNIAEADFKAQGADVSQTPAMESQKPTTLASPFTVPSIAPPQPVSRDPEGTSGDPEGPIGGTFAHADVSAQGAGVSQAPVVEQLPEEPAHAVEGGVTAKSAMEAAAADTQGDAAHAEAEATPEEIKPVEVQTYAGPMPAETKPAEEACPEDPPGGGEAGWDEMDLDLDGPPAGSAARASTPPGEVQATKPAAAVNQGASTASEKESFADTPKSESQDPTSPGRLKAASFRSLPPAFSSEPEPRQSWAAEMPTLSEAFPSSPAPVSDDGPEEAAPAGKEDVAGWGDFDVDDLDAPATEEPASAGGDPPWVEPQRLPEVAPDSVVEQEASTGQESSWVVLSQEQVVESPAPLPTEGQPKGQLAESEPEATAAPPAADTPPTATAPAPVGAPLQAAAEEVLSLQKEVQDLKEAEVALKEQLARSQAHAQEIRERSSDLERRLEEEKQRANASGSELRYLQVQSQADADEAARKGAVERAELREKLDAAERRREKCEEVAASLEQRISDLESCNATGEASLRAQLDEALSKVAMAEVQRSEAEAKAGGVDARITDAEARASAAQARCTEAEAKVVVLEQQIKSQAAEADAKASSLEARLKIAEAKDARGASQESTKTLELEAKLAEALSRAAVLEERLAEALSSKSVPRVPAPADEGTEPVVEAATGAEAEQVLPLLKLLQDHADDVQVCSQACAALESSTFTSMESRREFVRRGGVEAVLGMLERHVEAGCEQLQFGVDVLWNLTFEEAAVDRAVDAKGIECLAKVMERHPGATGLQGGACAVLLNLATRESHRRKIVESGCVGMVAAAMQRHSQDEEVLEQGCQALYMLAYQQDLRPHVLAAKGADAAALAAEFGGCGRAQRWGQMLRAALLC